MSLKDENGHIMPKLYFIFSAGFGILIFIAAFFYPKSCEVEADAMHASSHHEELTLKQKFSIMGKILRFWRVQNVIKYIFIVTLTIVNFEVFLVY